MKTQRVIGIVLLVVAGLLIAGTGIVYVSGLLHGRTPMRQDSDRSSSDGYYSPMYGYGRQTDRDGDFSPMMVTMIKAVAKETSLTVDEIQAKLLDGENLQTIAIGAGMSDEEYDQLMKETHDAFIEQYQDQFGSSDHFNWMQDRMRDEWQDHGFGSDSLYNGDDSSNDLCPNRPSEDGGW
jgi:hypothetical protein